MTDKGHAKSKNVIRIVVAEDHTMVREGLVSLLEEVPDFVVVGQAGDGDEALAQIRLLRPHIALLDITMPRKNGLEVAAMISREFPDVRVLMMTMHEEEAFFFEALHAGASGYILKGAGSEGLFNAIRAVHRNGVYLPPELAGSIVRDYIRQNPKPAEDDPLTPREREILTLIAQGLTNSMISRRLVISMNTVKTHRLRIYQKLNLDDKAALVAYAIQRGLLHLG
jgi:DNA-binding NarL/FixJ family response regulator